MSLLVLPDGALGVIGSHLPLGYARATSLACRSLNAAFPASLQRRSDESGMIKIRIRRPTDGRQLQSIAEWSRAYALGAFGGSWFTDVCAASLCHIHTLDLRRSEVITDVGVAALGNVHTLDLSGTKVTSASPRSATSTRST